MSKNPDLANFLLHKKSVSTKKFVKSVFYVIFTVVKSVDYCIKTFMNSKIKKKSFFFFYRFREIFSNRSCKYQE